jgi:hypothetical protein
MTAVQDNGSPIHSYTLLRHTHRRPFLLPSYPLLSITLLFVPLSLFTSFFPFTSLSFSFVWAVPVVLFPQNPSSSK